VQLKEVDAMKGKVLADHHARPSQAAFAA
jgi:hypothetical protein